MSLLKLTGAHSSNNIENYGHRKLKSISKTTSIKYILHLFNLSLKIEIELIYLLVSGVQQIDWTSKYIKKVIATVI